MDKNTKIPEQANNAIKMIGDDHTLCIIGNLRDGGMRFNELQRALDLNPNTLTDRLVKLENDGFLVKKRETLDKMSVVYELSQKGKDTMPITTEIYKFAKKHF